MAINGIGTQQLSQFRILFEEQYGRLNKSQSLFNGGFSIQIDDLYDVNDLSSSERETSMSLSLKSREAVQLKNLGDALKRISQGSFGICFECGEEIGLKRLQARPTTTLCVNCKEEQENRDQHHIGGQGTLRRMNSHSSL